jgi:hypothetical protein
MSDGNESTLIPGITARNRINDANINVRNFIAAQR